MTLFCSSNDLTSLIDLSVCYKNPEEPTCIDLILTNRPNYFQKTMSLKQANSHMMFVTELKMDFQKLKPIEAYGDYKHFDNAKF